MGLLGLAGMAPGPNTRLPHPQHNVYPYLLRGVVVTRPNQVWSTDITYIRLPRGLVYLVAVIDGYSRKVLAWRLSNPLDSGFCVDCLEQALQAYGILEIFSTDQGCQFTSEAFTGALKAQGIAISMDGRGRALDNIIVERLWRSVKHEDVYLKGDAPAGIAAGADGILCVLQHGENAPIPGLQYAGCGLPDSERGRSNDCGSIHRAKRKSPGNKIRRKTGAAPFRCV